MAKKQIAEFEITMLVRNNRLKKKRLELGFNQQEMAKACRVSQWGDFERLSRSPIKEIRVGGTDNLIKVWTESAKKIANFFCVEPEELWPDVVLNVTNNSVTKEISSEEMAVLAGGSHSMLLPARSVVEAGRLKEAVDKALDTLSPREADVLRKRFGLDGEEEQGLRDIGRGGIDTDYTRPDEVYHVSGVPVKSKVTRERVRQIEARALRALRHPSQTRTLRPFLEEN